MNYKEVLRKGKLQESLEHTSIRESYYCDAVMNMLELMNETEQIEYISSMPAHLQEASLKKQANRMFGKLKDLSPELDTLRKAVRRDNYMTESDKKGYLDRIDRIRNKINESLSIMEDEEFKKWYMDIDSNSGLFGRTKNAALPSRRSLGL